MTFQYIQQAWIDDISDEQQVEINQANEMTNYTALAIVEGIIDSDEEQQIEAWQHLIDTGEAWVQPGRIGRGAAAMIDNGLCQG